MFNWTQPVGQKAVTWRPLGVGEEMDIEASFRREEQRHLRKYEMLRRRIIKYGDDTKCPSEDFRKWDSLDLEMFAEDVATQEAVRRATLTKKAAGTALEDLQSAVASVQVSMDSLMGALEGAIGAARVAGASSGPL